MDSMVLNDSMTPMQQPRDCLHVNPHIEHVRHLYRKLFRNTLLPRSQAGKKKKKKNPLQVPSFAIPGTLDFIWASAFQSLF